MNGNCLIRKKNIFSLTTDYNWSSEGIGVMKGVILSSINNARIIDLCHTVKSFSKINGSRQFEMIRYLPVGIHILVVDPGVGTNRKAISILTNRGDILIGPDNGVMINAANLLGGINEVYTIDIRLSEQTVFDGRDVFAYSAGLIGSGKKALSDIGKKIRKESLCPSPLIDNQKLKNKVDSIVVHINHFGNIILNINSKEIDNFLNRKVKISSNVKSIYATVRRAFGNVAIGKPLLCDDGYGRYCVALNQGSAKDELKVDVESIIHLELCE
ncbi:MAG: hypothetical protein CVU00_02405 [Bacteroidetes bacterium HGW-Bacteroidetes-17]|jgi:hypothetical protein|nr:MAG: hypothetical protein CVU00_02405 [Bacteroidetes bacterium HGW-Bacteroidetes-17]